MILLWIWLIFAVISAIILGVGSQEDIYKTLTTVTLKKYIYYKKKKEN